MSAARRFCFELSKQNLPKGGLCPLRRAFKGTPFHNARHIHPLRLQECDKLCCERKSVILAFFESDLARRFCFELAKQNLPKGGRCPRRLVVARRSGPNGPQRRPVRLGASMALFLQKFLGPCKGAHFWEPRRFRSICEPSKVGRRARSAKRPVRRVIFFI